MAVEQGGLGLAVWAMSWVSRSAFPGLDLLLSATLSVLGQDRLSRPVQLSILMSMRTFVLKCNKKQKHGYLSMASSAVK